MKKITIGARGSKLSLSYAEKVKKLILSTSNDFEDNDIIIKIIKTSGDMNPNMKLSEIGGKNLFCKEIEEHLLDNKIDIAIHSLKDMEAEEKNELFIGAYIKRNDPRDVLVSKKIKTVSDLSNGANIGSSSRRREFQLKKISNKINVTYIRGNIDTRLKKLDSGKLDGIILAAAGIKSLGFDKKISLVFEIDKILPAVGQGIIAVQCRKTDNIIKQILEKINDKETFLCAAAERNMLKIIGGDCNTAIGGLAKIDNKRLSLKAQLFSDTGHDSFNYEITGNETDALKIGKQVGEKLLSLAGSKFKKK